MFRAFVAPDARFVRPLRLRCDPLFTRDTQLILGMVVVGSEVMVKLQMDSDLLPVQRCLVCCIFVDICRHLGILLSQDPHFCR